MPKPPPITLLTAYYTTGLQPWLVLLAAQQRQAMYKEVCPAGWHLPSDDEWTQLTNYLGGDSIAGGKLKETGTIHWDSPNTDATGFTALPAGNTTVSGGFFQLGRSGNWWNTTEVDSEEATNRYIQHNDSDVTRGSGYKGIGYSVRCVKD